MTRSSQAMNSLQAAILLLFVAASGIAVGQDKATGFEREGAVVYPFDPDDSTIRVLVYRGGFFANAGHNHVLAVENFNGAVYIHQDSRGSPNFGASGFELTFRLDQLILDRPSDRAREGEKFSSTLSGQDIARTRSNMLGEKGTDAGRYPEVRVQSLAVTGTPPEMMVTARISLHGSSRDIEVLIELERNQGQIVASGHFVLRQKDFGIKPFSTALGTLNVKNELDVRFRLVATREAAQWGSDPN